MIPFNPVGISDSFPYFCEALLEFENPPQDLECTFKNLILTYKQCLGPKEWSTYIHSLPKQLKKDLEGRFGNMSAEVKAD